MKWMACVGLIAIAASGWGQDQPPPEPPPLTISLAANDETETTILPGMPVTFTAVLENGPAVEAETARLTLQQLKASLDAAVARKAMAPEVAAERLAGEETPPPPAPPLTVRAAATRFRFARPGDEVLPWTARMLGEKDEPVALDGNTELAVTFVVSPEQTAQLALGVIVLQLRYDGQGAPAGEWTGTAESEEVRLEVVAAPAAPTPEQVWARAYSLSRYHLATEVWDAAFGDAQAMVQALPDEPAGYVQLGCAQEGKGDLPGALNAYRKAVGRSLAQDPDCPPRALLAQIGRLMQALGIKPEGGQP